MTVNELDIIRDVSEIIDRHLTPLESGGWEFDHAAAVRDIVGYYTEKLEKQ